MLFVLELLRYHFPMRIKKIMILRLGLLLMSRNSKDNFAHSEFNTKAQITKRLFPKLVLKFCTSFAVEKMVLYTINFPTFVTSIIRFNFPFVQFFVTIEDSMEDLILEALEVCFLCYFKCSKEYLIPVFSF